MATTTNYGWTTPNDTDLVKDGAAAIRTLGSAVDTTTKNLNPSTTLGDIEYRSSTSNTNTRLGIGSSGQVLTVAAGVPSWATPTVGDITEVSAGTGISVASGTGPIPVITNTVATAIDAKGDLIVGTGADTFSRLAVGTNTYILTADSAEATGLKWVAPAGGSTFVGCIATRTSSTQSISSATATAITLPTEQIDTNTFHDTSTNTSRFTIPSGKDGLYLIQALAEFNQSAGTYAYFEVFLNGSVYTSNGYNDGRFAYGPSGSNQLYGSTIMDLDATNYLEIALLSQAGCDISKARISISYLGA